MKQQRLLLGPDYPAKDVVTIETCGDDICVALSAGAHGFSAGQLHKIDANEDGVLAWRQDDRVLLAVADAHHGADAACHWLRGLASLDRIPEFVDELADAIDNIARSEGDVESRKASATSLVVAVLDRGVGVVFGVSFGDSSAWRFRPPAPVDAAVLGVAPDDSEEFVRELRGEALCKKRDTWLTIRPDVSALRANEERFHEVLKTGDRILLFTDGVDECCYARPDRSVEIADIARLYAQSQASESQLRDFVIALSGLALEGVRGHPGGQDNFAIAACEA